MQRRVMLVLVGLLTLGYPLLVFLGQDLVDERWIALAPLSLGIIKRLSGQRDPLTWTLLICSVINAIPVWLIREPALIKAYPSLVSAGFLILFGQTLLDPPSMVERIARAEEPDLPAYAVSYTKRVTQVWCVFFFVNGSISAWLAIFSSSKTWLIYTGCISYLLIGLLFGLEWCVRQHVRKQHA